MEPRHDSLLLEVFKLEFLTFQKKLKYSLHILMF